MTTTTTSANEAAGHTKSKGFPWMVVAVAAGIVSLAVGGLIGARLGRLEFSHEVLPVTVTPVGTNGAAGHEPIGPRLSVLSSERFDFGVMDRNETMTHVFEVKNVGDEVLTLKQESTSCKCTYAGAAKEELQPDETTEIKMEWNAKKGVDPFEQYAAFRTNDPRRPEFKLIVFGQILETLRSEPPEAIFNRVSSQESARATLKVFGLRGDKLEIIRHQFEDEPSAKFFEVSFQPLPQEEVSKRKGFKCGIEIIVELKPGMPLGQMKQTIQITTNLNPDATFDIPVYGSVVSDISLVGQHTSAESMTVSMGTIASAKGAKATVYFVVKGEHRDQTTLQITKVSPSAELEVKLGEPIRDNPQIVSFPVTLEVPPGTAPVSRASAGGEVTVRVETTHPSVKELTFRVRYAVVE